MFWPCFSAVTRSSGAQTFYTNNFNFKQIFLDDPQPVLMVPIIVIFSVNQHN
jgi:hypothetical protein